MPKYLTTRAAGAVPILPLAVDELKPWLTSQPASVAAWVESLGFTAEAGSLCLLPGDGGALGRVLAGVDPAEGPYGFAGLPAAFSDWVVTLDMPPIVIMICILLAYAVLGMFMDAIGMLILTLPVVYPAVIALGYDPIWFGIIVVKMAEICLITPPIGLNCFVVAGVSRDLRDEEGNSLEIPLQDVFRGIGPFFAADVATVGVLLAFPGIITWLPSLMDR